jgi:hypothetical protein
MTVANNRRLLKGVRPGAGVGRPWATARLWPRERRAQCRYDEAAAAFARLSPDGRQAARKVDVRAPASL